MDHTRGQPAAARSPWPDDAALAPLVRRAQRGDPGALDTLLMSLQPMLQAFYARGVVGDAAEDLVQETLLRILQALPRIDPARASRYVARVAQNRLRSACRRRAHDAARFVPPECAAHVASLDTADGDAEYRDLVGAIRRVSVATLSPKLRDCVLGLLGDVSPTELAAAHGMRAGTMCARLRLARPPLRAALGLDTEVPRDPRPAASGRRGAPPDASSERPGRDGERHPGRRPGIVSRHDVGPDSGVG